MKDEETTSEAAPADDLLARYEAKLRHIASLPELPMRRAAVDAAIAELEPDEAAWWIDQLIRGALWGREPEIDAMLACADWLIRLSKDDDYDRIQTLYSAAADAERESVKMLLRDPPPHHALRKGARLTETRLPLDRDVTVGERRSMARGSDRQFLERLLLDSSPLVIQKLVENPNLRLQDVLVIATRRPTTPDLVFEVALSTKWFAEHQVREAIVQNPYGPTGVALKLLPTLHVHTLRRIRNAGDLHPAVHDTAKLLVELREQRTAPWRI